MPRIPVSTGVELNYETAGDGDPLLMIMGTSGAIPLWGELAHRLAQTHRVITVDNRGLGGSDRGSGPITVGSMAADTSALLDALEMIYSGGLVYAGMGHMTYEQTSERLVAAAHLLMEK